MTNVKQVLKPTHGSGCGGPMIFSGEYFLTSNQSIIFGGRCGKCDVGLTYEKSLRELIAECPEPLKLVADTAPQAEAVPLTVWDRDFAAIMREQFQYDLPIP